MKFQHSLATFVLICCVAFLTRLQHSPVDAIPSLPQLTAEFVIHSPDVSPLNRPLIFSSFLHNEIVKMEELYYSERNANVKCISAL